MKTAEEKRKYNQEYNLKMPKEVKSAYAKKHYEKHREKIKGHINGFYHTNKERIAIRRKGYHLSSKYGITMDEYETTLKSQNGKCAICREEKKVNGKNLAVDHDHKTKKNRGILCHRCNMGIGYFRDDEELLKKAIKYLKKYVSQ